MIPAHKSRQTAEPSSAIQARLSSDDTHDGMLLGRTTTVVREDARDGSGSQPVNAAKPAAAPATLFEIFLVGLHDDMIALQLSVRNFVHGIDERFTMASSQFDRTTTQAQRSDHTWHSSRADRHDDP